MPYSGDWYIPLRVAETRFWGKVDSHDIDQHNEVCIRLLTEAQIHAPGRLIHMILDGSEIESLPLLYLMFSRAAPVMRFKNRDIMFFVTQKSTTRSIFELTAHVLNFRMRVFDTRAEALEALEAVMLKEEIHSSS